MTGHRSTLPMPGTGHPSIPGPHSLLRCSVSMETPLCLLPGPPLVSTSFSHLLSGWGTVTAARGPSPLPRPPLPSAPLPVFPSRKNGQPQARPSTRNYFLSRHWDYPSCHLPTETGVRSQPLPRVPLPSQQTSSVWPAFPCPADLEEAVSAPGALVSLLACCSLAHVTLWHLACSAL